MESLLDIIVMLVSKRTTKSKSEPFFFEMDGIAITIQVNAKGCMLSAPIIRLERDNPQSYGILLRLACDAMGQVLKTNTIITWNDAINAVMLCQQLNPTVNRQELRSILDGFLRTYKRWIAYIENISDDYKDTDNNKKHDSSFMEKSCTKHTVIRC